MVFQMTRARIVSTAAVVGACAQLPSRIKASTINGGCTFGQGTFKCAGVRICRRRATKRLSRSGGRAGIITKAVTDIYG